MVGIKSKWSKETRKIPPTKSTHYVWRLKSPSLMRRGEVWGGDDEFNFEVKKSKYI